MDARAVAAAAGSLAASGVVAWGVGADGAAFLPAAVALPVVSGGLLAGGFLQDRARARRREPQPISTGTALGSPMPRLGTVARGRSASYGPGRRPFSGGKRGKR